jgi:hypothetical protein
MSDIKQANMAVSFRMSTSKGFEMINNISLSGLKTPKE